MKNKVQNSKGKTIQKYLVESTILLSKQLTADISLLEKFDILSQYFKNTSLLKEEISKVEYQKNFKQSDLKVNKILAKLTDPKFTSEINKKISSILKEMESKR